MDELLRRRLVAAVGALLRHRHTNTGRLVPQKFPSVDLSRTGFAGRGFVANVVAVIAHD
jgi:hypothetical protein